MKMYTLVEQETCIACNACEGAAPSIFGYTDEGFSYSLLDDNKGVTPVKGELLAELMDAYEGCPTGSIKVSDEPFVRNKVT